MARRRKRGGPSGLLVVDKPEGPTSHDVVSRARKAFNTRRVGHAGTLDPMATGVLVLLLGEGTKLVPYVTAQDKRYAATVQLGAETDSLDRQGEVVERQPVPALSPEAVEQALSEFVGEHEQRAPLVSAIKVDGKPLHARVRAGEQVEAPLRTVQLIDAQLTALAGDSLELSVHCGKGFYVRSLARDLARALGTVGHLTSLRRLSSGPFACDEALPFEALNAAARGEEAAVAQAQAAFRDLTAATGCLPRVELTEEGAEHARHGRLIPAEAARACDDLADEQAVALFGPDGVPLAIGRAHGEGCFAVVRGFVPDTDAQ